MATALMTGLHRAAVYYTEQLEAILPTVSSLEELKVALEPVSIQARSLMRGDG